MRNVEEQMLCALRENRNWRSGNTEAVCGNGTQKVYLHGNKIAERKLLAFGQYGAWYYSSCGWQSHTTKSRLNALGAGIYQRNFTWYYANGKQFTDGSYAA